MSEIYRCEECFRDYQDRKVELVFYMDSDTGHWAAIRPARLGSRQTMDSTCPYHHYAKRIEGVLGWRKP